MTREDALDIFEDNFTVLNTHGHYTEAEEAEAITMAIKALEQEPCGMKQRVEKEYLYESLCEDLKKAHAEIKRLSEPCDAVSREEVMNMLHNHAFDYATSTKISALLKIMRGEVDRMPSVQLKQRTGRWRRISMDMYVQHAMCYYECSECGAHVIGEHKYCSDCGAKMEEVGG